MRRLLVLLLGTVPPLVGAAQMAECAGQVGMGVHEDQGFRLPGDLQRGLQLAPPEIGDGSDGKRPAFRERVKGEPFVRQLLGLLGTPEQTETEGELEQCVGIVRIER